MGTSSAPHITCAVFNEVPETLATGALHRFLVGEDTAPVALADAEARAEVADPFAELLLFRGVFPRTAGEVLSTLAQLEGGSSPLARHRFFMLGEGSQVPFAPATAAVRRGLRFLVACGDGQPDGPDILVSAFHPDEGDVELMAWDRRLGGFNFYRTVGPDSVWVFAGNSRHALSPPTMGNGPFESHKSGNLLMKELRAPWIHWDSPDAEITDAVFAPDDALRNHPWFGDKAELGAFTCETDVARPSIERWTRVRFDGLAAAGAVDAPRRVMEQILATPAVNIVSSTKRGDIQDDPAPVDLPATFFVDAEALHEGLGIQPPPPAFSVPRHVYASTLERLRVRLTDGKAFTRPGDAHFAFAVPERAFEDQRALVEAKRIGLVTERLAACLLMTDFPNPIFSARRTRLLDHVPERAELKAGVSDFSDRMADAILAAADSAGPGSPEAEFAGRWTMGDEWRDAFGPELAAYYGALEAKLATQDGFDDAYRLAESRRERVRREMAIVESRLLFSESDDSRQPRRMREDASVVDEPAR